jgi:hypothetical protein
MAAVAIAACGGGDQGDEESAPGLDATSAEVVTTFDGVVARAHVSPDGRLVSSLTRIEDGAPAGTLTWRLDERKIEWAEPDGDERRFAAPGLTPELELANQMAHTQWMTADGKDVAYDCYCAQTCEQEYCWSEDRGPICYRDIFCCLLICG